MLWNDFDSDVNSINIDLLQYHSDMADMECPMSVSNLI